MTTKLVDGWEEMDQSEIVLEINSGFVLRCIRRL
jgi:hypothetical protein